MKSFYSCIKFTNPLEYIVTIILLLYIFLKIPTPINLLNTVNSTIFMIISGIIIISLFFYTSPIIPIIALLALLVLNNRSKKQVKSYIPSEKNKIKQIKSFTPPSNNTSLEVSVVKKMTTVNPNNLYNTENYTFQSLLENTHSAANLNDLQIK